MTTAARFIVVLFSWLKKSNHVCSGFAVSQSVVQGVGERGRGKEGRRGEEDRVDPVSTDQRLRLLLNIKMHVFIPGLNLPLTRTKSKRGRLPIFSCVQRLQTFFYVRLQSEEMSR